MKYLITGLGNIGEEYRNTRHNIGFTVLDALAKASNLVFTDGRYGATATLSLKGRQLILLKPSTYMNLSGNAVRYWMQKENIPLENVLIVVDDLALPFGTLRLKGKWQRCRTQWFETYSCYAGYTGLCPSALWYRQRFSPWRTNRFCIRSLH